MSRLIFLLLVIVVVLFSCRRDEDFITDSSAKLEFSTDSVLFDTVFTTIGSITKNIRVYNPHKEAIRISSISLKQNNQTNFRINVDGASGRSFSDVEIAAEDSMYIFIEVTVNPNNQLTPFVIEDAIVFNTNSNNQEITLTAWGQNAIYFTPKTFPRSLPDYSCLSSSGLRSVPCSDNNMHIDVRWKDSLPYVVYGFVVIDSGDVLNIDPGVNVHFHPGGGLWVYKDGTLKVNGTKDNPVTFQGDRLEPSFADQPGQWDRIWINDGGQNVMNYAVIKNAFIGIQAEALPFENPDSNTMSSLVLKNTIIDNCSGFGLLTNIFNVVAENTIISNCGEYNVAIQSAGNYSFRHCTFANYFDKAARETPAFFIQNSVVNAIGTQILGVPNVEVYNSIIDGDKPKEFDTEVINNGSLNLDFRNTSIKIDVPLDTNKFKNITYNPTGIFKDIFNSDFSLNENSPVRDIGNLSIANQVPLDINGESRVADGKPDLGATEFKP